MKTIIGASVTALVLTAQAGTAQDRDYMDFTLPEMGGEPEGETLAERRAAYVDPQKKNGRICPDQPYRPGWVAVHEESEASGSFLSIGMSLYEIRAAEQIERDGVCTCENRLPSWEPIRDEYEELIGTIHTSKHAGELKQSIRRDADRAWSKVRQLCRGVR